MLTHVFIFFLLATSSTVAINRDLVIVNDGVGKEEVTMLQKFLQQRLGMPVRVQENDIVLSAASRPQRSQWDYSVLLETVHRQVRGTQGRVMLLTSKDTFGKGLNWSTGISYCNGTTAVVSVCRLNPTFWGKPVNKELWHERIRKIALHELGHTFGRSEHCSEWSCAIHGSNSIDEIDQTGKDYCAACAKMADETLKRIKTQ